MKLPAYEQKEDNRDLAVITSDMLLDFLHCKRKASLKSVGSIGKQTDFEKISLEMDREYESHAREMFLKSYQECEVVRDPPSLSEAMRCKPRLILNAVIETEEMLVHIPALARHGESRKRGTPLYYPLLFIKENKISIAHKLLLAFNALALASVQSSVPPVGKLIHGSECKVASVKIEPLVKQVRRLLPTIKAVTTEQNSPTVTLNRHCSACEFRVACQKIAEETDNLSLMRGMSEKEVEKQRSRGITTVTQFSHSFHPGRRGKRKTDKARKHDHALQAMAFRDKKVYVLDSPTIRTSKVALYLDVEGIPDRDFYYLIGLLAVQNGQSTMQSFWAEDEGQQKAMWDACAKAIQQYEDYTLYHYGSYELRFLDRMRLLATGEEAGIVDHLKSHSCNILTSIHSHIYFPALSNGLKDVGGLLGAKWSSENASGIQSLAWRGAWESRKDEATKTLLVQYNFEDCLALQRVTEFILGICGEASETSLVDQPVVSPVSDLQIQGFRFGKTEFFCPELAHINKCAYSDYQRERVYLRTSPAMRKSRRRKQRAAKVRPKANEQVECGKPEKCPECGSRQIHSFRRQLSYKTVFDLKFTRSGVKRWIIKYSSLHTDAGSA